VFLLHWPFEVSAVGIYPLSTCAEGGYFKADRFQPGNELVQVCCLGQVQAVPRRGQHAIGLNGRSVFQIEEAQQRLACGIILGVEA